jgi:hypothetical protein
MVITLLERVERKGGPAKNSVLCDKKEINIPYSKLCDRNSYDTDFFYYTQVESEWYALKREK